MPGRSLRTCSAVASTRNPAAGHEVLAACLESLQPPVLVAVAFVVQAPARGICSLFPDLIDQPLRGSLRLQLPDRQWIPRRCINGLAIEHQRVAWVVTVVGNDQASGHNLSPWRIRTSILEPPRRSGLRGAFSLMVPGRDPLPPEAEEPTLRKRERESLPKSLPSPLVDR
jgi:hypothetical protein